jgi:hypothetical protein
MTIARSAKHAAAAALCQIFRVKPFLDPLEADQVFVLAFHGKTPAPKLVKALTFIARPSELSTNPNAKLRA